MGFTSGGDGQNMSLALRGLSYLFKQFSGPGRNHTTLRDKNVQTTEPDRHKEFTLERNLRASQSPCPARASEMAYGDRCSDASSASRSADSRALADRASHPQPPNITSTFEEERGQTEQRTLHLTWPSGSHHLAVRVVEP